MQHKVTDRQLTALVATYFGQRFWDEPAGVYGEAHEKAGTPYWRSRTNMGGAVQRMVESLKTSDFVTDPSNFERRAGKPYADKYGELTVKGYEALAERLDKLPTLKDVYGNVIYRFTIQPEELAARKQVRADREAEMDKLRKEEREAELAIRAAAHARAHDQKLATLRELFKAEGLADNWDDQRLLQFADRVASV